MKYGAIIPLPLGSASEISNNSSTETILMLFQLGCVYLGYLSLKLRLYYRFCITFSGYHFLQVKWYLKKLVRQIESCCIRSFLECLPSVIWINGSWELSFVYQKTCPFMKMSLDFLVSWLTKFGHSVSMIHIKFLGGQLGLFPLQNAYKALQN